MLVYLTPEEIEEIKAFRYPSDTTMADLCHKIEVQAASDGAPRPITKPVCPRCGGDNIVCDANAVWSVDAGAWELSSTFDSERTCVDCCYESDDMPFVVWEGDGRGKWVPDPNEREQLSEAALARLNDNDAVNPGFVDLTQAAA